jgi:hypothetical protein
LCSIPTVIESWTRLDSELPVDWSKNATAYQSAVCDKMEQRIANSK